VERVRLSELRDFTLLFPGDVFVLAAWVLANDLAYSARSPGSTRRTTIHGLAGKLAYLTDSTLEAIRARFLAAGFPLGATLEPDEDQTPQQVLALSRGVGQVSGGSRLTGGPPAGEPDR
jgi:hypothetical protein